MTSERKHPNTFRRWAVVLACAALLTACLSALSGAGSRAARTPREALDFLLETYPMPENAVLIETEGFLGWQTPFEPLGGSDETDAQQSSVQLCYWRLTPNEKYYEFWLYSSLLDAPSAGAGHCSTLNFYAVSLYGDEILVERTGALDDAEHWDVYLNAIAQ